jgi:hypothetical protein
VWVMVQLLLSHHVWCCSIGGFHAHPDISALLRIGCHHYYYYYYYYYYYG